MSRVLHGGDLRSHPSPSFNPQPGLGRAWFFQDVQPPIGLPPLQVLWQNFKPHYLTLNSHITNPNALLKPLHYT